ncbi:hypothetical protein [Magnetospirillum sp. UT-4]|uniref:hypothetical protein n=1 Tax=Magnetospirillum sp. UT-4 TaxID=2681467 RepID=UPI00137ED426|nr:hypothetical protein [Magnetospirillum sp. UT-4]CAA7622013.1 conserved exported hypothetical protein [Magnetospirillum sp. UT-4]
MRPHASAVLGSALLLAACAGNPQTGQGPAASVTPAGAGEPAPAPSRPAIAEARRVPLEPTALKGLSPTQLRSMLGAPVFTRRDTPAEIWQYRGRSCTLDLFLYDDGGGQIVAHYAVRSAQPVSDRDCVDELLGRTRPPVPAS